MEDGASPYQIDLALRDFGFPMVPFKVADLTGSEIGWAARKRRANTRDPKARYVQIADRICERGVLATRPGEISTAIWIGARTSIPDPEIEATIDAERYTRASNIIPLPTMKSRAA